ncbi:hypothetical protein TeGR_g10090 [Tetraparma gracilis]|uniref:Uncharacterized protein n=1 Tax=Tetraparma gracilis TaxID=2962635 RepID=A0ABQ6N441_9STRA|nr:hypothetical protein TeGR_g10090 [Tetraparma gracilis]
MTYTKQRSIGEGVLTPQTKVSYTQQVDLGGSVPKWVQNSKAVDTLMYLGGMRKRFDKSLQIDAAISLRLVSVIQSHSDAYTEAEESMLREGAARLAMFIGNKCKVEKVKSASKTVTNQVAFEKGKPLGWGRSETLIRAPKEEILAYFWDYSARCRWGSTDVEPAVGEWVGRYPALKELEEEYSWFRPMMDTIAQRLLESVSWGLKMRLYTGASLSTLDMVSDLYMIYRALRNDLWHWVPLEGTLTTSRRFARARL